MYDNIWFNNILSLNYPSNNNLNLNLKFDVWRFLNIFRFIQNYQLFRQKTSYTISEKLSYTLRKKITNDIYIGKNLKKKSFFRASWDDEFFPYVIFPSKTVKTCSMNSEKNSKKINPGSHFFRNPMKSVPFY